MKIIALHGGHDSSITALEDGKILYLWELERILEKKHFCNVDYSDEITGVLLNHCLPKLGWKIQDIDLLVFAGKTEWKKTSFVGQVPQYDETNLDKPYAEGSIVLNGHTIKCYSVTHHVNHLACAYYTSPYTSSLLYSLDGLGDRTSGMAGWANKNKLYIKYSNSTKPITGVSNNGIGLYYSYLGDIFPFLGKDLLAAAGKAMGLSSYGSIKEEWIAECTKALMEWMPKRPLDLPEKLGLNRKDLQDPMNQNTQDLMATIQESLERYVCKAIKNLKMDFLLLFPFVSKEEAHNTLCMAGGCALNVLANTRLLKENIVKQLYVPPVTSDCGISLGASLYVWHHILDNEFNGIEFFNPYIGDYLYNGPPDIFSGKNITEFTKKIKEKYPSISVDLTINPVEFAADVLSKNKIIAWVRGKTEVGPRSLGNRSILFNVGLNCDKMTPTKFVKHHNNGIITYNTMKDVVNAKVKHREWWRPFAPICLAEDAQKWFDIDHEQPYMLEAPLVKDWGISISSILQNEDKEFHMLRNYRLYPLWHDIAATVHVDGTARVQTVSNKTNAYLYNLLRAYKEKTGIGVLGNTSLNDAGIPINNNLYQILDLLVKSELDYAIIDNWIFYKE